MLVAEKRMLCIKVPSIKSSLSLIRAEMKLLKNCSKVLSDSGTGFKRSWGVVSYFSPFLVTSDGCLPGLADHSKGLARWVALSWKTCKQYSWVVCFFFFFPWHLENSFCYPVFHPEDSTKRTFKQSSEHDLVRFILSDCLWLHKRKPHSNVCQLVPMEFLGW